MNRYTDPAPAPLIDWQRISTVLLDMDGTLLDKYYDDYFWEHYLPQAYGSRNGLSPEQAQTELFNRYRSVEKTLMWTDLNYWSEQLELDIVSLKKEVDHLVAVHPHVIDFLDFLRGLDKELHLVTAADRRALDIKMGRVDLRGYFTRVVCAGELGLPKEDVGFWRKLEDMLGFNPKRTMFADDNLSVLRAAENHHSAYLIHIAKPSSRAPLGYSHEFMSVASFGELLHQPPN